jgi:hypothetical protein
MKRRSTENELIDIAAELRHETQAWLAKDKGLCDE